MYQGAICKRSQKEYLAKPKLRHWDLWAASQDDSLLERTLLEIKPAFPRSEPNDCPLSWEKDLFVRKEWLKKGKYELPATRARQPRHKFLLIFFHASHFARGYTLPRRKANFEGYLDGNLDDSDSMNEPTI